MTKHSASIGHAVLEGPRSSDRRQALAVEVGVGQEGTGRTGMVRVDVLEVRQVELDRPSDDPGDRLLASAHAWAHDTATDITIEVLRSGDEQVEATAPVAEPGPLIAMKLQAVMNRLDDKQGTDLLDIVRLTLDASTRPVALEQIKRVAAPIAGDIALHVDLWFVRRRALVLSRLRGVGGDDLVIDDIALVGELLMGAARRGAS